MTDGLTEARMNIVGLGKEAAVPSVNEMFPNAISNLEKVTALGVRKHGAGTWANPENPSLQTRTNCDSMFHHLAEHFMGLDADPESGVDPLLHLAWRALAKYERKVRGIENE